MTDQASFYDVSTIRRRKRKPLADVIKGPECVYGIIHPLVKDADREHFYALYLNARNRPLAVELVSVGSLNASIVHPREVFKPAVALSAAAIILAHNHPSGDPEPSDDDRALTRRLVQVGELLGIAVLDHLVVANGSFASMKQYGWV